MTEARADRYGFGGDDLLEDAAGRAIRVFEGLVLRIPAERVPSIGLTEADLDASTVATVPAVRKLWTAGTRIDAEPSTPISVGGAWGTPPERADRGALRGAGQYPHDAAEAAA